MEYILYIYLSHKRTISLNLFSYNWYDDSFWKYLSIGI